LKKIIRLETGNGCTRIGGNEEQGTRKRIYSIWRYERGSKEQTGIELILEDKLRGDEDEGKGSERGQLDCGEQQHHSA
jgi:hypothetical protein